MTEPIVSSSAFARLWGVSPSTIDLISFVASEQPEAVAFEASGTAVAFGALNTQAQATASVFAAQGMDTDLAVNAAISGTLAGAGMAPAETAVAMVSAIEEIRRTALGIVGADSLSTVPAIVGAVARRAGDRVAVQDRDGRSLTYRELDESSDRIAAALVHAGAGPEVLVGVGLPRTADLVVALLGVLKSGAAYIPLDTSHPLDRLGAVVDDGRPLLILTAPDMTDTWSVLDAPVTTVDELLADGGEAAAAAPALDPGNPAYVMYTSGSTGKPKGVVITHHDVVAFLSAMAKEYDYSSDDVWSMFQSYAFDVSVSEIWTSLAFGGRLVIADFFTTRSPKDFAALLDEEQVTVVNLTPSAFYQLAGAVRDASGPRFAPSVRSMILAGEALDFEQVRRWYADRLAVDGSAGPQLNNMYGPTEATVFFTRRELSPEFVAQTSASDIGAALPGGRAYVLDARLNPVPEGVPGDLYLAGEQLARGYAGRFDLNASRFVADPFSTAGGRMYQSGDVAIVRGGGLEYLGRSDDQVKLRGFRIELGEVEAGLSAAEGVVAAAAAVKERDGFPAQLVGYVTTVGGEPVDGTALRRFVATKVPEYMVPDLVMVLEQLPLNVNGKLHRAALPEPVVAETVEFVEPASDVERELVDIFTEVLGLERISVVESIFDVGGNSLLAARIVGRVGEQFGVDLTIRDLFDAPTARELAAVTAVKEPGLPAIEAATGRGDRAPLSLAQQRMWFINRFDPAGGAYNIPMVLRIAGDLDHAVLRAALLDVIGRHEVLRTRYAVTDAGESVQVVMPPASAATLLDWADVSVETELADAVLLGFDLADELPLRVRVWSPADGPTTLLLVAHHIAFDGESFIPLVSDLMTAYAARADGQAPAFEPLPVQIADYAIWQRSAFGDLADPDSLIGKQLAYWEQQLDGMPGLLEIPTSRPRPSAPTHRGGVVEFEVDEDVSTRVAELAKLHGASPFMVAHAALSVLLGRLAATDDVAVGTPIAGRGQSVLDPMIGMFVNTLVLRTRIDAGMTFSELIDSVRATDLAALANADVPFESVVERVDPVRSEAFAPLAQVWLSFDQTAIPGVAGEGVDDIEVSGLRVSAAQPETVAARVDLTVGITDHGDGWRGHLLYATDLYDEAGAAAFAERFVTVLAELTAAPQRLLGSVHLLTDAERSRIAQLSQGAAAARADGTVDALLASVAAERPDGIALLGDGVAMTYAEFGARVNDLATHLIAAGIAPDAAVAVCLPRSPEQLIAVHAVLAAGGQYVPVDPATPGARIDEMVKIANVRLALVGFADESELPDGLVTMTVDAAGPVPVDPGPITDADRVAPLLPEHAAYTLFTSGSTGVPKGVTVSHRAIGTMLDWLGGVLGEPSDERVLVKTQFTFDASVWELLWPVCSGATAVLVGPEGHRDPDELRRVVRATEATTVQFVPSMLSVFLEGAERSDVASLRRVLTGGESLSPALLKRTIDGIPGVVVSNQYGLTEAAVDTTIREYAEPASAVTIGGPVPGSGVHVLDARLHPVPAGVRGELYVTGPQLARGYAAAAGLSAERFVASPFAEGERMYRTGDVVRWTAAGEVEYLGRSDFQVKLNGQRIELEDIETVLAGAPQAAQVAAAVHSGPAGDHLVAYVTGARERDLAAIKDFADEHLPAYMRPSVWMVLDALPVGDSGKVDRAALPDPDFGGGETVAAVGEQEEAVAAVFADLLGVDEVSVTESFFDLGGNSLAAMRVAARVSEALGAAVSVRDVFDAPSVRELVEAASGRGAALPPIVAVEPRPARIPLSFAQQRMWFINQFDPASSAYNIPLPLKLTGDVDLDVLRRSIADVVARHEVLRTTFPSADGAPVQVIGSADSAYDALDWAVVDSEADLLAAAAEGFDVSVALPMRVRVHRTAPGELLVLLVLHHIAADGQSMRPLVADLLAAYTARAAGAEPSAAPLPVQVADVALWQHEVLGEVSDADSVVADQVRYWRAALDGIPDVLNLPGDRPRPAVATQAGEQIRFALPATVGAAVRRVAAESGATDFIVLHAALAVFLSRMSATDDIAIGTPVAGRGADHLDALIGMFVNTLVLRTEIAQSESFADLLSRVRTIDLAAYDNADVPFEAVVDALSPARSEAFAPLTQVLLSFHENAVDLGAVSAGDLTVEAVDIAETAARVDLTLTVEAAADGDWSASLVYATDLFDRSTAESMMTRFTALLGELTANPAASVGDAPFATAAEAAELIPVGGLPGAEPVVLPELFERAARSRPEHPAVVTAESSITYAELDAASNRLARHLIAAGVGAETHVALAIPRSIELMTAIWAVAKAGGAYVPIDPDYPADRVAHMIADSGAAVGLTVSGVDNLSPDRITWTRMDDGDVVAAIAAQSSAPIDDALRGAPVRVDATAYVIYTSGSTGRPKGVSVTHRGLANFGAEESRRADADQTARVLGFASPSFDASVLEYLMAFTTGGTLAYRPAAAIGGDDLQTFMRDQRITHTFLTPTVLASIDPAALPDLLAVYAGGEAVPAALKDQWSAIRRIQNLYGPTETTIGVTIGAPMRPGEPVTLGGPIDGVGLLVLDSRLHPVPEGVLGELYIAGVGLSRGYLDRPALTAERFVADPFGVAGERLYRTGDVVRWTRDADDRLTLAYGGRSDDQVKLRGLRIELGEIESVLAAHPAIASAVVLGLTADGGLAASGESVISGLTAYYVPLDGDVDQSELRDHLAAELPLYMVPSGFTRLDALPLTPVGKLDKRGLPAPQATLADVIVEPTTAAEETLAAIVSGLLGLPAVSVTESFFALGGDSIMSIQLASAARAAGIELSPREIFEQRTIRAMAAAAGARVGVEPLAEPEGGPRGTMPLPPIVSWMIEHSDTPADFADMSQSMVLRAPADLTLDDLAPLLDAVVASHPMLSASLTEDDGAWTLTSGEAFDPSAAVSALDAAGRVGSPEFDSSIRTAFEQASAALDPAIGRLVHAVLVSDPDGAARIVLVIHHLGVDAVSWRPIIEDLVQVWAGRRAGRSVALRGETTSARAWSSALAERIADHSGELGYWLDRLPAKPTELGARVDRDRDRVRTVASHTLTVPSAVTESLLTAVPEAFGSGVNDALLAALGRAVRSWQHARGIGDSAPVSVAVEGHGRYEEVLESGDAPRRADLSRTVGWFTTLAPVSIRVTDDLVHTVKAVKEELRGRPSNGIGFAALRYGADTELSARPLPVISFNYLGNVAGDDAEADLLPDASAPRLPATATGAMVAPAILNITVGTALGADGREFAVDIGFPAGLLDADDVADLAERWTGELAAIADLVRREGGQGLSPSDVPGAPATQADLDMIGKRFPGAAVWPLSTLQRGLHFQAELAEAGRAEGAVDVYIAQAVVTLGGEVDENRLQDAARGLLARHRVLRSGYLRAPSGTALAVVPESVDLPWTAVDVPAGGDSEAFVAETAAQQRALPFDMTHAPLIRFVLVRDAVGRTDLIVTSHHILLDGWSSPLMLADMLALYATGRTYTESVSDADTDFEDFLTYLAGLDQDAALAAWRPLLADCGGPTLVAPGHEATTDQLPRELAVRLDTELTSRIDDFARTSGVTLSTVLQFAWGVLLSRITGRRKVAFGETVSGRPADLAGVESMVGLFINTLPVVVDVEPAAPAADVLAALQAAKVSVLDHQHVGLPELIGLAGGGQLFDTLTVHESYPVDSDSLENRDLGGMTVDGVTGYDATHYPLTMVTAEHGGAVELKLKYLPNAFGDNEIEVFADALRSILGAVADDPSTPIATIPLGDDSGYAASVIPPQIDTRNAGRNLVELFAETVDAHGANAAVSDGMQTLTYAELDERSTAIAAGLTHAGVVPGDLVAVATGRSVDLSAAILGVLKTGAGYLPLDTTNPADRLRFIVEDAAPSVAIVDEETADLDLWLSLPPHVAVHAIGDLADQGRGVCLAAPTVPADGRAYVIYTSGSTGRPKGVEVTHRDVVTLMDTASSDFDFRSDDVWTMFHSYAFDFSVWELWGPLLSGARLLVIGRDVARVPAEFLQLCADEGVTVLSQTPSAFYQFAQARRDATDTPLGLRYVVFGGEELNFEYVRRWFDDFPSPLVEPVRSEAEDRVETPATPTPGFPQLVNMYGITETTVHVTFRALDPESVRADDASFIGRPLASLGLHLLDERLRPVPDGIVGEISVTGGQLAQSYLNRPGLSAERFVANPFGPDGSRMYRTGDLARRVGDDIAYLGRGDAQVQLRGYRIEFGEIEAGMLTADGVTAAAAAVVEMAGRGEQLVGYVVLGDDTALDAQTIRTAAGKSVPAYMVPDLVVAIEELPLTANGKLDRAALPAPDAGDVHEEYVAPADDREAAVAGVFAEVLGLDRVGVATGFFDLGGNSLSATRLAARVSDVLGTSVSVRDVFGAPTVRDLVAATADNAAALPPVTAVVPRPDVIPLSFAQTRMWFINQLEPDAPTYNIPVLLRIRGDLDLDAMRGALADVVARHETLRTTYPSVDGDPRQLIHGVDEIDAMLDWQVVESRERIEAALVAGFDVATQLPLRARLLQHADESILALVVHHIATDGESMRPLVADVIGAYLPRVEGRAADLPPLRVQMADYALWQHRVLGTVDDRESVVGRQLHYWRTRLAGLPDLLELPADRPRPHVASGSGGVVHAAIPAPLAARVTALAADTGTTPFMVLHAALAALLSRLSATEDIAIATPVAGRGQAELDSLVGMFVNTLVLRTEVHGAMTFADLLTQARTADLDAFANADVPFESVVDALNPIRSQAFAPLAQVLLTFAQSADDQSDEVVLPGLTVSPITLSELPAQRDLTVTVSDRGTGGWDAELLYARDLFDAATIESFARRLVSLLDAVVGDPSTAIGDVRLLDDAELASKHVVEWGAEHELPAVASIPEAVAAQIAATPDAFALLFGDREVSYAEFGARVNTLARELISAGVGPDVAGALCIPRSVEMMVAIHAVLAAGGQYVPIDTATPSDRARYMIETAGAEVLLVTDPADVTDVVIAAAEGGARAIRVDATGAVDPSARPLNPAELLGPIRPDTAAYTLFTSGSTGRPKGVTLSHEAVLNRL
ncbi:non-ribosomal peptide synthetase, partial [Gordonia neofelifaecis]